MQFGSTRLLADAGYVRLLRSRTSAAAGVVPIRDTKTAPTGAVLTFPTAQWARFLNALHQGQLRD